jgi:hypothetical protein
MKISTDAKYCALCDKPIIERSDKGFIENNNYSEVKYFLSNNSKMRVGFCKDCYGDAFNKEMWPVIMRSIVDGWSQDSWKTEEIKKRVLEYYNSLNIIGIEG